MKWSWKGKKKIEQVPQGGGYEWLDKWCYTLLGPVKRHLDRWGAMFTHVPKHYQKMMIVAFFCLGAGLFTYLGIVLNHIPVLPAQISIPKHTVPHKMPLHVPGDPKKSESYQRIAAFRYYVDSLKSTSDGRKVYDSLYARHKGVFDSLDLIEP
ncbi:hypothetical protein DVR12_03155 [Chitinophaga silvatica]|uniref:Uncharacterized protein n=1 Tax=Chitinophaga silvatica TaxID=2282649 RepID=A0A3E1YHH5_9BACT|nr:hypothetical protein [Chitinophaga silvatica]RFS26798.1 hypothetical protein DVR12_03155 [Chitinophaga silvatica]